VPRRDDIHKILLIGSGPIVIGQAAEFDYSGTQACKVLKEEGYEVVLVNSNPATIMTDPEFADATSLEQAEAALGDVGLPAMVRPAYTLGGWGGGVARSEAEFRAVVTGGLAASPIGQVLIDQSL